MDQVAGDETAQFRALAPNRATHSATQRGPRSLHAFYKAMLKLRNTRPSLARGSFEQSFADGLPPGAKARPLHPRQDASLRRLPARSVQVFDLRP